MGLGILTSPARSRPALGEVASLAQRFPWHVFSKDTLQLQQGTNLALQAAGYCPVPPSGVLDAATCRARDFLSLRLKEFFGQEGVDAGLDYPKPPTCRYDDPSDPPSAPVPGCFQPTGYAGLLKLREQAGFRSAVGAETNWILIGGIASLALAAVVATKYSRQRK